MCDVLTAAVLEADVLAVGSVQEQSSTAESANASDVKINFFIVDSFLLFCDFAKKSFTYNKTKKQRCFLQKTSLFTIC